MLNVALSAKIDEFFRIELPSIVGSKAFQLSTRLIFDHSEPFYLASHACVPSLFHIPCVHSVSTMNVTGGHSLSFSLPLSRPVSSASYLRAGCSVLQGALFKAEGVRTSFLHLPGSIPPQSRPTSTYLHGFPRQRCIILM